MNFAVYRSSAGSGKTYTLVKEYLAIVLKKPSSFRGILAITFTNKAANEMRERIIRSLTELAAPLKYSHSATIKYMLPDLEHATGLDADRLTANASEALVLILHNYQDFSVSTIDSFIHRVVRTFAFDLRLPLNFEVEVDEKTMVSQAVDLLMSRVGIDDAPTKALTGFTTSRISDEKSWDIEKILQGFSRHLLRDDIVEYLPLLKEVDTAAILKVSTKLADSCRRFENEVVSQASALKSLWERNGIGAQDLYYGKTGIWGYIDRLSGGNLSKPEPSDRVKNILGEDTWYAEKKTDASKKAIIDSLKPQMIDMADKLITYIEGGLPRYMLYGILKRNIHPLAVLKELLKVMDQIRETDGVIHISEFDKRIAMVVDNEPVPFIYERLGEKYNHFLVDEFQDTSVLEWQNILPLIENALSVNNFSMVVGDPKQAIYRFKGGEVEQLVKLPEIHRKGKRPEIDAREMALKRNYEARGLDKNFRSREEIIKFNNEFYAYAASLLPDHLKGIYLDCQQKIPESKPGGEVRISFIDTEGKKDERETIYLDHIFDRIKELQDNSGYDLSDIAILCRSNKEASKIARSLLVNGIEVISAESLLLASSPEVIFLVASLDHIADERNQQAVSTMITYLARRIGPQAAGKLLGECFRQENTDGRSFIMSHFREILEKQEISYDPVKLRQMGLYERTEELVRLFSMNNRPDPYVLFFLDVVHEFARNRRYTPGEFTTFWRENNDKYSIVVPEGLDAVRVMTIHKAKGLEFPVVIYPFANDKVDVSRDQRWVHIDDPELDGLKTALLPMLESLNHTAFADLLGEEKDMAKLDLLNILYVATTRSTERLFLICDKPSAAHTEIKNIPALLRSFLEHKMIWDDSLSEYSFGSTEKLPGPERSPDTALQLSLMISGDWRQNIILSAHAADYWDLDDDSRNIEWGNLVHRILSGVNTADDLEPLIAREAIQGNVSGAGAKALYKRLKEVLDGEEIRPFFEGNYEVRNEAAIMTREGEEYRPDRLMFDEGKAIVIDYKTGKMEEKHIRQIERYGLLLNDMGFHDVRKYLLYLGDDHSLVKV